MGGVGGLGNSILSALRGNLSPVGTIAGLPYSLRSARVSTCVRLPYGTSPPKILDIKRLGVEVGFAGVDVGCHCGGGDTAGLLLRTDSGVVARSSSVLSRSETKLFFLLIYLYCFFCFYSLKGRFRSQRTL